MSRKQHIQVIIVIEMRTKAKKTCRSQVHQKRVAGQLQNYSCPNETTVSQESVMAKVGAQLNL